MHAVWPLLVWWNVHYADGGTVYSSRTVTPRQCTHLAWALSYEIPNEVLGVYFGGECRIAVFQMPPAADLDNPLVKATP